MLFIDLIVILYLVCLGMIVFIKKPDDRINISLSLSIVLIALWLLAITGLQTRLGTHLFFARLAYALGLWSLASLVWFVFEFTKTLKMKAKYRRWITGFIIISFLLDNLSLFTDWTIRAVERSTDKIPTPIYGDKFWVFPLIIAVSMALIIGLLLFGYKRSTGILRAQIKTIAVTTIISTSVAILTNVIIPSLTGNAQAVLLFPISITILVSGISYAIIKHRLFNIRIIVARSIAYSLSIAAIFGLYSITAFSLVALFFKVELSTPVVAFFAAFSALTALIFQPVKRFFDKMSNSIFYRDAYDAHEMMNIINTNLVHTVDVGEMLGDVAKTIKDTVKLDFCHFYITLGKNDRIEGVGDFSKTDSKIWEEFANKVTKTKAKITNILDDEKSDIAETMRQLNVATSIRMFSQDQTVGYLLAGEKRSGSNFTHQDIQVLEIIADEVAIAVQNALRYEEIAQFNITLQSKVDTATRELKNSNEKLKALDEAKDEFISMASHQLRTPLTSVKGFISMMLEGDAGELNKQQKVFLNQAFISSQRMVYLIADLLNVSRLKTGKFIIEAKPTYLPEVVAGELDQLYGTAEARGIKLIYDKPAKFPALNLDETKTRQVVMNFVDNAIYYTPKGGTITVALNATKDSVEYTVTDTGIGIPKADQPKLFTKFYRAGNARKVRPDGTGLGLFMAKKVVIAQGGAIIFKSTEGKGSTFGFSFPRAKLETEPVEKGKAPKELSL